MSRALLILSRNDPPLLGRFTRDLSSRGYDVTHVETLAEAQLCVSGQGPFDLVSFGGNETSWGEALEFFTALKRKEATGGEKRRKRWYYRG